MNLPKICIVSKAIFVAASAVYRITAAQSWTIIESALTQLYIEMFTKSACQWKGEHNLKHIYIYTHIYPDIYGITHDSKKNKCVNLTSKCSFTLKQLLQIDNWFQHPVNHVSKRTWVFCTCGSSCGNSRNTNNMVFRHTCSSLFRSVENVKRLDLLIWQPKGTPFGECFLDQKAVVLTSCATGSHHVYRLRPITNRPLIHQV